MIWTIAKKEFFEKILDFRVIISFAIAIVLTVVATLVAGSAYQVKKAEYDRSVARAQSDMAKVKVYSQFKPVVFFPPSPLSVFCQGIDVPTPITVDIDITRVPQYEQRTAGSNPLMSIFDSIDLAMVIRLLFTLLVILLTFDAFSAEKERGTLRLMLSNPVARLRFLHGKFLGILMIIAVVVGLTFLLGIIMVRMTSGIGWTPEYYLRASLLAVSTMLFLAVFAALGIFTSIQFHASSTSLVVLLFLWLFIGLLQPNLNTYLVSELENKDWVRKIAPLLNNSDCDADAAMERLQNERGDILKDHSRSYYGNGDLMYGSIIMRTVINDADYDILDYTMQQVRIWRRMGDCAERDFDRYDNLYLRHLDRQLGNARTLELFSPAALFSHGAAILSRTDIDNVDDFFDQARRYRREYLQYLDAKGIFSTDAHRYFSRLNREEIDRTATGQRIEEYRKGTRVITTMEERPPLDLRDAPAFQAQQSGIGADIGRSAQTMLPFLVYLAVLFLMSGKALKLYDPR